MHFKTAVALGDVAMVPKSTVNEGWNGGVWLALWRCLFRWESAALWTADGCVRLDHVPVGLSSGGASTSVIDFALGFPMFERMTLNNSRCDSRFWSWMRADAADVRPNFAFACARSWRNELRSFLDLSVMSLSCLLACWMRWPICYNDWLLFVLSVGCGRSLAIRLRYLRSTRFPCFWRYLAFQKANSALDWLSSGDQGCAPECNFLHFASA